MTTIGCCSQLEAGRDIFLNPGGWKALYLRTIEDARLIRARLATARRIVCIGAGVIGLEIASSARQRGAEVTVLEALPRACDGL